MLKTTHSHVLCCCGDGSSGCDSTRDPVVHPHFPPSLVHSQKVLYFWMDKGAGRGGQMTGCLHCHSGSSLSLQHWKNGAVCRICHQNSTFFFFFSFFTVNGSQHLGGGLSLEVNSLMCAVSQKNIYSLEFSFNIGCVFSKWVNWATTNVDIEILTFTVTIWKMSHGEEHLQDRGYFEGHICWPCFTSRLWKYHLP